MADVDSMSAAELRTKLAEFGYPVMPITSSTRAVLVKKLKMLMAQADSGSRKSLAKYSSGEDSDLESTPAPAPAPAAPRRGGRSSTATATAPPPPPPVKANASKNDVADSEEEPEVVRKPAASVSSRRTRSRAVEVKYDYETGSDSEVDAADSASAVSVASVTSASIGQPTARTSTSGYSSTTTRTYTASDLNPIRSRLGLAPTFGERPIAPSYRYTPYVPDYGSSAGRSDFESPYLSGFDRKLSAIKAEARERLKESDVTNGSGPYNSSRSYDYTGRSDPSPDFKRAGEKNILRNNIVSLGIVGVFVAFFLALFFAYLGMKSDVAVIVEDKNNVIPVCAANAPEHKERINCVKREKLSNAMDLMKILYPELVTRAVDSHCGSEDIHPYMTENDIVTFVKKTFIDRASSDILLDLHNLQVLTVVNPKWGISVIKVPTSNSDTDMVLTSMEYIQPIRNAGRTALVIQNPPIPLKCYFWQKINGLIFPLIVVAIAISVVYVLYKCSRVYLNGVRRRNEEIYSMVEQIIDTVSQESSEDGTDTTGKLMPIDHVRDMLIPPQNRDKMSAIWNAAIKFIEKNESRVRFEVDIIGGEQYRSLRWVSIQGSPRANRGGARAWQGQAFETQQGSVNNLAYSPTPCLKIRHMVDKNDKNPNLKTIIQDAILEKCGPQCKILHIEIDKISCCVFVKCASPADAGIVYQNLHGWWYEGNLITVKYLRLERYMDHFPNSPSSGPYLKPSSQS